ncbi:MAG: AMP-binding protein [Spirochaetes bacterium]|nr:AMP-binding protein [Spirochaetota bacterium]
MIKHYEKTLSQFCLEASELYGDKPAFGLFQEDKICEERKITYKMMGTRSRQIALLLKQLGILPGDRVMLLSENSPEWPLAYFGIAHAGAVIVPLLPAFSADQVQHIANHAEVSAIILNRTMAAKIEGMSRTLPLIFLDSMTSDEITVCSEGSEKQIALPDPNGELPQRKPEDLAVIIYTSGTSGNSKGVMLSHKNLVANAITSQETQMVYPGDRFISVLPLAHAYECTIGMLMPVMSGANITYLDRPPSASILLPAAKKIKPTLMLTVPLFIEKIYRNAIKPKMQKSKLYHFFLTRPLVVWVAGRKLKKTLGGKIHFFGIGGAPLAPEVEKFLRSIRFPYAIGYGLTETAPLIAGSPPHTFSYRSTGKASPGVELRIAPVDNVKEAGVGEIQARGPNVMMGYFRNEQQTREAFTEDGWFRTGDLGRLDKKGMVYICGRIKALILGPGGENIYPEEIEGLLGSSNLIEEALVYLSEKGELIARVRLSDAAKEAAVAMEKMVEELRAWANKKLASFSRLSKIIIQEEPFEKTPTMKIKRYLYIPNSSPMLSGQQ